MNAAKRTYSLITLFAIGLGISAYQTYHYYLVRKGMAGFDAFCKFGSFDCIAVESSKYAELFWGLPLSGFAAGWYIASLILCAFLFNEEKKQETQKALFLMTAFGTALSLFYLFIMAFVLKTYCILCIAIDVVNILALILIVTFKPLLKNFNKTQWKSFGRVIAGSLVVALVFSKMMDIPPDESKEYQEVLQDILASPPVPLNIPASANAIGPEDAPITLVKFSDLQCPSCMRAAFALHPVLERYKNKIRFVMMHFPLDMACNPLVTRPMHAWACDGAKFLACASKQGQFKQTYEAIFKKQAEINTSQDLNKIGDEIGLNSDKLKVCMADPMTAKFVSQNIDSGVGAGVNTTPTFYINGIKIIGGLPTPAWIQLIDRMLKR